MAHLFRRFVILCATLALIVTSVGWGTAGALKNFASHHESELALTEGHPSDHHPADRAAEQDQSCSVKADCATNASHEEPAEACCATACHIATEASAPDQAFFAIVVSVHGIAPNDDTTEAASARLERPPRPQAA